MLKQEAAVGEKFMEATEREAKEQAKREEQEKEVKIANEKVAQWEKGRLSNGINKLTLGFGSSFPLLLP